ncbi:hypothetical protein BDV93DRAFT_565351 [Ceratobasidium sp. AG-I]|nr:hypothetical protein BDV93DRAFT_565351 [Ceratobasidium sp. AG-I]
MVGGQVELVETTIEECGLKLRINQPRAKPVSFRHETTHQGHALNEDSESLTNLSMYHIHDFNEKSEPELLEGALGFINRATSSTPGGDSELLYHYDLRVVPCPPAVRRNRREGRNGTAPSRIKILANLHEERYDLLNEPQDLDQTIKYYRQAVFLSSKCHPGLFNWLGSLASLLHTRFKRLGELTNLDEAVDYQSQSISLTPQDHSSMSARLDHLGSLFDSRFQCLGELADMDQAVECKNHAVSITPEKDLKLPMWLNNLAYSLDYRFQRSGELADLNSGIA